MARTIEAGVAYFSIALAAGFVLGSVRVLVLVPWIGEPASTAMELPAMLAVTWIACRRIIAWLKVPDEARARIVMGAVAFGLLMIAELGLGVAAFGRSFAGHLAHYATLAGGLGLAGQVLFACFPEIQRLRGAGG